MDDVDVIVTSLIGLTYVLIGLCLGSFSSAIAYRIKHHQSWIVDQKPNMAGLSQPARSACPSCHHQLSVLDLIPVFSWAFLGGKCRYCATKISIRYPLIEVCGAASMLVFWMTGQSGWPLLAFVITLPFALTLLLMVMQYSKPPLYIYGIFFSNVFVLLYAILWRE